MTLKLWDDILEMETDAASCRFVRNEVGLCHDADDVFAAGDNNCLKPVSSNEVSIPRKSSLKKDDSQRLNSKKKTVSFSSAFSDDKTIACATDCLYFMQSGSVFIKVRSNGRQYKRVFLLSSDLKEITWHPSSKKPHKARIMVDQIKEIQCGRDAKSVFSNNGCFFSIITGESFEPLDLIASSADEANIWITGLNFLKLKKDGGNLSIEKPLRDKWLENVFRATDADGKGEIRGEDAARLMKKINGSLSFHHIQRMLRETSQSRDGDLRVSCSEFVDVFKKISARPDVLSLFVRYSKKIDYMTSEELKIFAETEQGMTDLTMEKCKEMISTYEPSAEWRENKYLGIDGFSLYLMSVEGSIFDPCHSEVHQDMNQPLSHYFIASSCDVSSSSNLSPADKITSVLRKGCRLLTIDCWDGPNDEPMAAREKKPFRGFLFRSAMETINDHAFLTSRYPVIINLLNHCSQLQQKKLVVTMKEVFKDKLASHRELVSCQSLASPESLKGRIILMGEKFPPDEDDDDDEAFRLSEKSVKNEEFFQSRSEVSKEMFDCILIDLSCKRQHVNFSPSRGNPLMAVSLNESLALKLSNASHEKMLHYNKKHLTLVSPNISRNEASNYHPYDFWNFGCQFVSMNYHANGAMMDLNDGMFSQNGCCGYVLKPVLMREEIASIRADSRGFIPGTSPQILYIRIISALNLPKPEGSSAKGTTLDPYVTIEVNGILSDCAEQRTRTIPHLETWTTSPMFEESFEFVLNFPDFAAVRFAVLDDEYMGDDFIGQCTIPVVCMRQGYRHIPLKSTSGDVINDCFLFVHVALSSEKRSLSTYRGALMGKKRSSDEDFEHLKLVGLKAIDDNFKSFLGAMKEANDLLSRLHESLTHLRESCGLTGISNVKQTIRHLFGRIQNLGDIGFEVQLEEGFPALRVCGNIPDVVRRSIFAFETFILDNFHLQSKAGEVTSRLAKCRVLATELHEDLPKVLQSNGIRGRKLTKAIENCAWNIRLLKGQEDLLRQAEAKSVEHIKQVIETSQFLGLIKETSHDDSPRNRNKSSTP